MTVSYIYLPLCSSIDHKVLQQHLDTLTSWAETWQMQFNFNKCSILQLFKHHHKRLFPYSVRQAPQDHQATLLFRNSSRSPPFLESTSWFCMQQVKVTRLIGFLQHNLHNCSKELKTLNYKHFAEFCITRFRICSHSLEPISSLYYINKTEMVQHRSARFVLGCPWY